MYAYGRMFSYRNPQTQPKNEIVTPVIPETSEKEDPSDIVDYPTGLNGTYCKEITYDEHLNNLELMCKADRAFMKRVREFCEENAEEAFNVVKPLPDQESTSEHAERGE